MNLFAILNRIDQLIAERETSGAAVSRVSGRNDIVRVFRRAVEAGRGTNVATLEAIASGLGVSEQWLIFGSETVPNVDLENRLAESESTIPLLREAVASFLSSIGLQDAEDFVGSLEEIARKAAKSKHDAQMVHDLRQQALGLSFQAARKLHIKRE